MLTYRLGVLAGLVQVAGHEVGVAPVGVQHGERLARRVVVTSEQRDSPREELDDVHVAADDGHRERGAVILGVHVDVGVVLDQQPADLSGAQLNGDVEGARAALAQRVGAAAGQEQQHARQKVGGAPAGLAAAGGRPYGVKQGILAIIVFDMGQGGQRGQQVLQHDQVASSSCDVRHAVMLGVAQRLQCGELVAAESAGRVRL
ncbi:acyl-CoA dehydrogenase [Babesia caballi]|uniref:Acyl-CoA dehydrogenase n=1 Tax=Babesia caballi TaxID=5871 RepID=A0AAV4LNT7_BABCB|nr:acyl-CoA dehydrogenase [Babesia caballi]